MPPPYIEAVICYRFLSIDLDFTWRGDSGWADLGPKQVRSATRDARNAWRQAMAEAAKMLGYRLDDDEIDWGSSSRMGTAYFHYKSMTGEPSTIKVQVNFVEPRVREDVTRDAHTLISREVPLAAEVLEGRALDAYRTSFPVACYDAEEIAAEKVRAILTRRAPKGRDVLDLFLLESELGVRVGNLDDEIRRKLDFALGLGEKYNLNLDSAPERLRALADQDIRGLLLKDVDAEAFEAYRNRLLQHVRRFLP